jgi:hypothetical protein
MTSTSRQRQRLTSATTKQDPETPRLEEAHERATQSCSVIGLIRVGLDDEPEVAR